MTMPDELRRALGWLPELLNELSDDASLDDASRTKALALASVLPKTLDDWLALDSAESGRVGHVLGALESSVKLLSDLRHLGLPRDPARHRKLLVVLRHQPVLWGFDFWRELHARGFAMGSYITRLVDLPLLRDAKTSRTNGTATASQS
jgi:hypothetical protein